MSSPLLRRGLPLAGLLLALGGPASRGLAQTPLTGYALFGGDVVALASSAKINAGLIGSNGNIVLGPQAECVGLEAGGKLQFSSTGGGTAVNGPLTFNGDIALGVANKIKGPINCGGSLTANDQSTFSSDITTANDVVIGLSGEINGNVNAGRYFSQGAFNKMTGDVLANGGAIVGGLVTGNVTATHLHMDDSGRITGKVKQGSGTVTPAKYAPVAVPPADTFEAGTGEDSGSSDADSPLKPGKYGALNVPASRKVYLTSGDYYFSSVTLGQSASLRLVNISSDKGLRVYVTGDVSEALWVTTFVNGKAFTDADSSLAGKVVWEVMGKFDQTAAGNGGSDEWFGTIFTPVGRIVFGNNSKLTGSLISGGSITAGTFFAQTFVPAARFAASP